MNSIPSPHPCAGEIKRRPEVETLLVTADNRTEVMKKVLNWLTVEGKIQSRGQKATPMIAEELHPVSRRDANPYSDGHQNNLDTS